MTDWAIDPPSSQPHEPDTHPNEPDWSRERKHWWEWAPSRSLMASIRAWQYHAARRGPFHRALRMFATLRHRFWSVVCGAEIPPATQLGGGLLLPHPNGIVVHPQCVVGPNCLLFQHVTLGTRSGSVGVPTLGAGVDVGAGARILGGVTIGDGARIGANAVVLHDVPAGAVAVGIPARIAQRP